MTLYIDRSISCRTTQFIAYFLEDEKLTISSGESVSNVALPALRLSVGKDLLISGLCHVTRQIVKHACHSETSEAAKMQMESYLGYKQNCLKACAAVSNWTKFCEVEFPDAVKNLKLQLLNKEKLITLPNAFVKLEKEFSVTKKTPNVAKYFCGKKAKQFVERDRIKLSHGITFYSIENIVSFLDLQINCKCQSNNGLPNLQKCVESKEYDIKSNEDITWPYLCGLTITIADFLIFATMLEFVSVILPCCAIMEQLFEKLPLTMTWFLRCASYPGILSAARKVYQFDDRSSCANSIKKFSFSKGHELLSHVSFEEKPGNPKQMHIRITKNLPRITSTLRDSKIEPVFDSSDCSQPIQWADIPAEVNPAEGELKEKRALRKRQQIENMVSRVLPLIKSGDEVVDFCAGGGHLGIVIAFLRPDCKVTLLENKEESIDRAISRIDQLKLSNVSVILSNLEYLCGNFDVGVTLHACGSATDLVLQKCIKESQPGDNENIQAYMLRASFVVCPCCYGSIRPTDNITYPKSKKYQCLGVDDYFLLARSADQTSSNFESDYSKQGKISMLYVDHDRLAHACEQYGYYGSIFSMVPETCSPKNNLLVGTILR